MRQSVLVVAALVVAACDGAESAATPRSPADVSSSPLVGESPVDRPFVAFTEPSIVIDGIGVSMEAPVSVASRPSPATMASDAPDVVSIGHDGRLVAHRAGTARIRSLNGEGQVLHVTVDPGMGRLATAPSGPLTRPPAALSVNPARARMTRGAVRAFQAFTREGGVGADWTSSAPHTLLALGGGLFQAISPGRARACAEAFGKTTCSEVEVTP